MNLPCRFTQPHYIITSNFVQCFGKTVMEVLITHELVIYFLVVERDHLQTGSDEITAQKLTTMTGDVIFFVCFGGGACPIFFI